MASNAVSEELISTVVGYKIKKGVPATVTQNLPQRIAILCEVNTANQSSVNFDEPVEITSAKQAGELFGFGSPAHSIMRILRPVSGSGVAGIPTIVYPQEVAGSATARVLEITPTGVASKNATHTVKVCGRSSLDGATYNFTVNTGDTTAEICQKIEDAINNVEGSPFTASNDSYSVTATTKWKGLTSQEANIEIDTNDIDADVTYVVTETTAGAGTPAIGTALANFGDDWNTVVINSYSLDTTTLDVLEAFNGLQARVIAQEFIKEAKGADIRVFIVDGEIVGAMKRQGKEGEFRSNLHRGGTAEIIKLSIDEKNAALKAARVMGLGIAGVDLLQSARGPLILEVNSSPGLEGIESATGVDIAGKIIHYLERHVDVD